MLHWVHMMLESLFCLNIIPRYDNAANYLVANLAQLRFAGVCKHRVHLKRKIG
jgi:hypothetical protein